MKKLSEEDKKRLQRKIPALVVTALFTITFYFSLYGTAKVISIALTHYFGREYHLLPFLFFKADGVGLYMIPLVTLPAVYGWLLGTRTQKFSTPRMRVIGFYNSLWAIGTVVTAYGMTKLQNHLLPFFYNRINRIIETDDALNQALFSKTQSFFLLVELLPVILMLFISMFLVTRYRRHDEVLQKAFFAYKWTGERLRKFEKLEKTTDNVVEYPDIELGINKVTNEMVVLPGFDRTLNTAIVGSIGTGKTAALGLPMINQDLHYFTEFINKSPSYRMLDNYISEDIQGRFLNGLSIIEPSNDLCRKVYQLAKAHGISDKAITYIDPTNPNTPGLNFLKGPVEKVSEVFAQVLAGLADNGGGGNFYFEQAQRSHLKQHIYLLKLHKEEEVTFDDLLQMYEDTSIVNAMHMQFKKRIREKFPEGNKEKDLKANRDRYNEWLLYSGIDKWFDNVIVVKTNFQGVPEKDIHGHLQYIDLFEKDVKGLRNILNDIGRNPLLARVLNGKSEFDFDKHMGGEGGILLVNTAKGQLEALGGTLGKMVLMTLQNASFRREPNVSPFHHILIDEAPEYYYSSFASFPAQSRKFKVIITTLQQTLTQLRGAFGEDYMNSVIAAMRNRMVYADVSNFDGDYFSKMFGEKETYQEGESEQVVSPLQDDPVSRSGSMYQKVKDSALTSGDILFQEAFECAVKIVVNNRTMEVQQIKANFVPKEEFQEAVIKVDDKAMEEWVNLRYAETTELLFDNSVVKDDKELVEMHNSILEANRIATDMQKEVDVKVATQEIPVIDEADRALDVEIPKVAPTDLQNIVSPATNKAHSSTGHSHANEDGIANEVVLPQVAGPKNPLKTVSVPKRKSASKEVVKQKEPNTNEAAAATSKMEKEQSRSNASTEQVGGVREVAEPLEEIKIKPKAKVESEQDLSAEKPSSEQAAVPPQEPVEPLETIVLPSKTKGEGQTKPAKEVGAVSKEESTPTGKETVSVPTSSAQSKHTQKKGSVFNVSVHTPSTNTTQNDSTATKPVQKQESIFKTTGFEESTLTDSDSVSFENKLNALTKELSGKK